MVYRIKWYQRWTYHTIKDKKENQNSVQGYKKNLRWKYHYATVNKCLSGRRIYQRGCITPTGIFCFSLLISFS